MTVFKKGRAMALSITIAPAGNGWAVQSPDLDQDQVFASGSRAEAFGRDLAAYAAREGEHVELRIMLRDGTLAATLPFGRAQAA